MSKLLQIWKEETTGYQLRLMVAHLLLAFFPVYSGSRIRPAVLRGLGFKIGEGTVIMGMPTLTGGRNLHQRLSIGRNCVVNIGVLFNMGERITIQDGVAIGHQVMILTESHGIGPAERRAAELTARPVAVGAGAWLGARSVLLPGISVGAGSVIASGAVVSRDIPENVLAAGVPARVVKELADRPETGSRG